MIYESNCIESGFREKDDGRKPASAAAAAVAACVHVSHSTLISGRLFKVKVGPLPVIIIVIIIPGLNAHRRPISQIFLTR